MYISIENGGQTDLLVMFLHLNIEAVTSPVDVPCIGVTLCGAEMII